jgi:hypothetical protein
MVRVSVKSEIRPLKKVNLLVGRMIRALRKMHSDPAPWKLGNSGMTSGVAPQYGRQKFRVHLIPNPNYPFALQGTSIFTLLAAPFPVS